MPTASVISHKHFTTFEEACSELNTRTKANEPLQKYVKKLSEFPFGRFLIQHRGLNGFWTHYVCTYPQWKGSRPIHALETEILETFPVFLATQERFRIFQKLISQRISRQQHFASIPCGLMGDLLLLDHKDLNINITGIDLDTESLTYARKLSKEKNLLSQVSFESLDAWKLGIKERFNLITSNGLNIYEPDNGKVTDLYRQFFLALKTGGTLVTSYLAVATEWDATAIDAKALERQKQVFGDLLQIRWACLRSEAQTRAQLLAAGFSKVEIFPGFARMFPSVVAQKKG